MDSTNSPEGTTTGLAQNSVLVVILLLSLALNLVGITWGLPNEDIFVSYEADELVFLNALRNMDPARLDLNPDNLRIGSGVPYMLAVGIVLAAALGQVTITGSSEYYLANIEQWARMYLIGRLISVVAVTLSAWVMYLILRELLRERPGWVPLAGAFLTATMPGMVQYAHFLSYSAPVVLWVGLSFYLLLRLMQNGRTRFYVLSGLVIGSGIAVRYTAALLVPFLLLAHVFRFGHWRGAFRRGGLRQLLGGYLCIPAAFVAFMPYALLDWRSFISQMVWGLRYATPLHIAWSTRLTNLWTGFLPAGLGWGLYLLSIMSLLWLGITQRHHRDRLLILLWLLPSLLVANLAAVPTVGRLLPILYVLVVPATLFLAATWCWAAAQSAMWPRWIAVGIGMVVGLITLGKGIQHDTFFLTDTVRADASDWIQANILAGETIGYVHGGPFWASPDLLNQDYYHPELTGELYRHVTAEDDWEELVSNPPPYIVTNQRQYRKTKPEHRAILAQYELATEFMPVVPLDRVTVLYGQHASEIRIFRWVGAQGSGQTIEEMCAGW